MIVPLNVDVPMDRWPWANWAVIAGTVLLSAALFGAGAESELASALVLGRDAEDFRAVQLVGHLYAHGGILHLLGNMVFLFCFGNAVNAKLGHLWYLALYHALGVLAGLGWLTFGHGMFLVGASGAIMGVVGAFVVFFPKNDVKLFYFFGWFWRGTADVSAYWVIGMYVAFDVWGMATAGKGDAVAYVAHVVGAAAGAGAAIGLLKLGFAQPDEYEQNLLQVLAERRAPPEPPRVPVVPGNMRVGRADPSAHAGRTGVARAPSPAATAACRPATASHGPAAARRPAGVPATAKPPIPVASPIPLAGPFATDEQAPAAGGARPGVGPAGRRPGTGGARPAGHPAPASPKAARGPAPSSEASFTPTEAPDPYDIR